MKSIRPPIPVVAALLALVVFVAPLTACGGESAEAQRKKVVEIAGYNQAIGAVLDANASLPDQLFADGLIAAHVRDRLATSLNTAMRLQGRFQAEIAAVLASEKPGSLKALVPLAAGMVGEVRTIRSLVPEGSAAARALSVAEYALRAIAIYFAVARAEARARGHTDRQLARSLGVVWGDDTRRQLDAICDYARTTAGSPHS